MKKIYNFTRLVFKTTDENSNIQEAMLATFPEAEWNESRKASCFKSFSLRNYLIDALFENADEAKREVLHEFDVYSENMLVFSLRCPNVELRLRKDPQLADAKFEIVDFVQYSDTDPREYYYYDIF